MSFEYKCTIYQKDDNILQPVVLFIKYIELIAKYTLECSEKYKSFKLKIPQPDSERRHSPDFRTVFGIMIGPFSSCKIGKT